MKRGFTLIETVVALLLLATATVSLARILSHSLQVERQATLRFHVEQKAESHKNYLLSLPFADAALTPGAHRLQEEGMVLDWRIDTAAAGLIRIALAVSRGGIQRTCLFYKSQSIKEVIHHD